MLQQVSRILAAILLLSGMVATISAQTNLTANANSFQPAPVAAAGNESDRARDGLVGSVRRVRTEVAKLSMAGGKVVEDNKRVLLEIAEYDLKGNKTQNQYFPIAGATLTGREVYKYDEKSNISEMTLVNAEGSLVSKEIYKYDFDSVGNWIKMTASIVVVENGRVGFEPTEVTYRTIFYYLDAAVAKTLTNPSSGSTSNPAKSDEGGKLTSNETKPAGAGSVAENVSKLAAALPPPTSLLDKSKLPALQPALANVRSESVGANKQSLVIAENEPPPAPRHLLKPISGGVLNGKALVLPSPLYPEIARRMHTTGLVEVEVVIDETGKVISARALSGPASLRDVAVQAAYRARFTPTKLTGQPVKVSGTINYNFTLTQ